MKHRKRIISLALTIMLAAVIPVSVLAHGHGKGNGGHGHQQSQGCGVTGCTQTGSHSHNGNGNGNGGHHTLCNTASCNIIGVHQHNGVSYAGHYTGDGHGHHQSCTVSGCHGHTGHVTDHGHPNCPLGACRLLGIHSHDGKTYTRADYAAKFSDVSRENSDGDITWYYKALNSLAGMGIIVSSGDNLFSPNDEISRAEFAYLLFNTAAALGADAQPVYGTSFNDVSGKNHWAAGSIGWACENGIITGYSSNTFRPDEKITRQDIAVMMQRFYEGYMGVQTPQGTGIEFRDSADISGYAGDAVRYVSCSGIMQGDQNGYFAPREYTRRCHVVQMLYNSLENYDV